MRIVFANQKGGVGKSTLCMLFADYLVTKNIDCCIMDIDLQKTISMQRKKDEQLFNGSAAPYNVQTFEIKDPTLVNEVMISAKTVPGAVLFDAPGNISEDGLLPIFVEADVIICPYKYEDKTLDSTGVFIQVIQQLKDKIPTMKPKLLFVPNSIDNRIGTEAELKMWKQTDEIFKNYGMVSPRIPYRANLQRVNTFSIFSEQISAVKDSFDFIIAKIFNS